MLNRRDWLAGASSGLLLSAFAASRAAAEMQGEPPGEQLMIRGKRLFVQRWGPTTAPVVVYLHGGPGTGSYDFAIHQGERLSRRLQLVLVDQRGVLRSEALNAEDSCTLDDLVEDTEALRRELGIERWSVLGHSSGGLIAARYVIAYPESVERVVFENPTFDWLSSSRSQLMAAADIFRKAGEVEAAQAAASAVVGADAEVWPGFLRAFGALGPRRSQLSVHGPEKNFFDTVVQQSGLGPAWGRAGLHQQKLLQDPKLFESLVPELHRIIQPALLIKGLYDLSASSEQLSAFEMSVALGRISVFERSSHFARFEEPDRYAQVVGDFLTGA